MKASLWSAESLGRCGRSAFHKPPWTAAEHSGDCGVRNDPRPPGVPRSPWPALSSVDCIGLRGRGLNARSLPTPWDAASPWIPLNAWQPSSCLDSTDSGAVRVIRKTQKPRHAEGNLRVNRSGQRLGPEAAFFSPMKPGRHADGRPDGTTRANRENPPEPGVNFRR